MFSSLRCVIQKMCISKSEYQFLNPTTQLSLLSICSSNCTAKFNISWNIYQGSNQSSNMIQWTPMNSTDLYDNIWIFGKNTKHFTISKEFFTENSRIKYWKFEVIYSFPTDTTTSALHFIINDPPQNGSCSIHPPIGIESTLFNIFCTNWFDEDDISDYSLYGKTILFQNQIYL
jgi:hypothetical protein